MPLYVEEGPVPQAVRSTAIAHSSAGVAAWQHAEAAARSAWLAGHQ